MLKVLRMLKDKNFSIKLKTQLIASFIGMSFIILIINSAFIYVSVVNLIRNQSLQENINQFKQLEYNINTFSNEVDRISRLLIISNSYQDFFNIQELSDIESTVRLNNVYADISQMVNSYEYIESIYYYGENGIIIGASATRNDYLVDKEKKSIFYSSDIYQTIKSENLRIHWCGGLSSREFDIYKMDENTTQYITAARSVNYLGKQTATLVININEKFFTSIYNSEIVKKEKNMYIMDNKGSIISHIDELQINIKSPVYSEFDLKIPYGSIITKAETKSYQVIYYRLGFTGWIIVSEIPYNLLIKDINRLKEIFIFMFFICLLTTLGISIYWMYRLTRPLNELALAMHEMEKGKLGHVLTVTSRNELGFLGRQFNKMSASIQDFIHQIKVMENDKRLLEIEALQSQINPHFLYNTLNTIKYMAVLIKANNIASSITALGNILTPIYKNNSVLCTIKDEIEYLKNYIQIMNYRYGEGIKVIFSIPEELQECEILRFMLQPIVENSLTYGFAARNDSGIIDITAAEENDILMLIVKDNGEGMDEERFNEVREALFGTLENKSNYKKGIGLANVHQRIKLHFGESYGIEVYSKKGIGTKVTLKLPKVQRRMTYAN